MTDTTKLIDLAKQHGLSNRWPEGRATEWLNWMDASGCVFTCYPSPQDHDNPMGFCVVRPISDVSKFNKHYHIDHKGDILYCDLAVSENKQVTRALVLALIQRYGLRSWLASEKNKKLHIHSLPSVAKALFKNRN